MTALLIAYLLMVGSGLRVAVRSQRSFSKLLATGLSLLLAVQVFVVVGGITRIIPITGITLPFVSYGGSSLVSNYILLAILLRISNDNAAEQALAEVASGCPVQPAACSAVATAARRQRPDDRGRRPVTEHEPPGPVVGGRSTCAGPDRCSPTQLPQVFHASALDDNPLNTSGITDPVRATPRRHHLCRRRDPGPVRAQQRPVQVPAGVPRRRPVRPDDRVFLVHLRHRRAGERVQLGADPDQHAVTLPANLQQLKKFFTAQPAPDNLQITVLSSLQKLAAPRNSPAGTAPWWPSTPRRGPSWPCTPTPATTPTRLASHNQAVEQKAWEALQQQPGQDRCCRPPTGNGSSPARPSRSSRRPPCTTTGRRWPTKVFPVSSGFVLPDTAGQVLHNFAGEACGGKLLELFTVSCDTGFAQLGLDVGAPHLSAEAKAFGWDQSTPLDLPGVAQSYFPPAPSFAHDQAALAKSAIGQESVQAAPLTLALDAAGIANGGVIMTPHLLDDVTNPRARRYRPTGPGPGSRPLRRATATKLTDLMLSVVNSPNGTGVRRVSPGYRWPARQGQPRPAGPTSRHGSSPSRPVPDPQIAVAVLVENQPPADEYQGGTIAAPIAKAIIQAYLQPAEERHREHGRLTGAAPSPATSCQP